jgi:D-arabinose 1-dehydrogenase-like Zn-dependent alcohol dehydrogenase
VLVHAGSGGVGAYAIQLAKHLGATVTTTTGTSNLEWVRDLGADLVIDYRTQDFEEVAHGYDIVLDSRAETPSPSPSGSSSPERRPSASPAPQTQHSPAKKDSTFPCGWP